MVFSGCKIPSKSGGEPEQKEVLLQDNDVLWVELRHAHIAEVFSHSCIFFSFKDSFPADLY